MDKLEKLLRSFLIFGAAYFIFDGLLHFFNIKLSSAANLWPGSAISYGGLMNAIYASFIFLASGIMFIIQGDLEKYKAIIRFSAIWALFHGSILVFLISTQNYQEIFKSLPSLLVWLTFYREYLLINSILLFLYSGIVYLWIRSKK